MVDEFKHGDIVRYGSGISALFRVMERHGERYYGLHVLGGGQSATDIYNFKLRLADAKDVAFARLKRPEWFVTVHRLKIWPEYYFAIQRGEKTFDVREVRDRKFCVNDFIEFEYFDTKRPSDRREIIYKKICYILPGGQFGIQEGYAVLGLKDE